MRWSGYLDLTGSGWFRAREVAFRVTTEDEGVTLVVGNRVLLDCVGTATPPGTYNCGSNQDVSKKLWPGMRPITIEYAELSGDASFRLEWKLDPMSPASQWQVIPASAVRTNLGLLTRTIRDAAFDPEVSRAIYTYADDDAKARHLPSAITEKDTATGTERRTEFTYNQYGQTRSVTTAAGTALAATTRYDYVNDSTTSCLQQVTVPLSAADQAAQTGAVTTFECDDAGDVTEQTQVIRAVAGTEQLAQTRTTTTEYDSLGRVTKVTTPLGGSTTTLYDAAGRPAQVREYLGTGAGHDAEVTTSYVYDDAGHLLSETLPPVRDPVSGQMVDLVITHVWDWLDDEVSTTDERGKTRTYVYDALRRLIQTTSPLGLVARTEYRLVSATGTYQHQVTVWSPPGDPGLAGTVTTVTSYNVRGWVDSVKVGSLASTTYQYDPLGRRTRETAPSGVRTDLTYNGFDQLTQRRDFAQSATPATTTYSYDAAGRLSTLDGPRTDADDSLTSTYDLAGNLTQVRQNGIVLPGTSTVVTSDALYNDVGEQIQIAQPLTTSLTQVRDWVQDPAARTATFSETRGTTTYVTTSHLEQAGWISSITDPRGITLSFEHDNLGRQTRQYRSSPSVADDQTFTYDLAGNMLSATVVATSTTVSMDYDDDGRLWKVYQASGSPTTTYTYSATTGQLVSLVDPAGTASFTYRSGDGLIQTLTDPFSGLLTYTYDSAGRMTKRTVASGGTTVCLKQAFESGTGRIDYRKLFPNSGCSGTYRARFDLGYDLASNITSRIQYVLGNASGSDTTAFSYTYDGANRLLTSTAPSSANNRAYTWDGGGNRISVKVGTGTPVTTTYDSTGLPVSSSDGITYTHDAIGNLTMIDRSGTNNDRYFTYSSWSQLTKSAKTAGGSDVVYTLDALDRVLSRAEGSSTAAYTYSGVGETLAKAQVGATTTLYAGAPEGPLGQKVGTTVRYYLSDLHGDLVGWSTMAGTLQGTAAYDPFGQVLSSTGEMGTISSQGALRFQGDLTDLTTGQVDMGARYYEPILGGFSSRDPVSGELTSPITLNAYGYAGASPVTNWDPTGMNMIGVDVAGSDKGCGRKCQDVLADPPESGSPAVESTPAEDPSSPMVDWVQTASAEAWSPYVVGEDFTTAFARLLVGWSCEEGRGCAPVNPGSVGARVTAQLAHVVGVGASRMASWRLSVVVIADVHRINPESGYELGRVRIVAIRGAGGRPVLGSQEPPLSFTTDAGPGFVVHFEITRGPQPRSITVGVAAVGDVGPIYAVATVGFDPIPTGPLAPYPTPLW